MNTTNFSIDDPETYPQLEMHWSGILPKGWFFVSSQIKGEIVASCMALVSDTHPNNGELGWLACDPEHQGIGLGAVVS